MSVSEKASAYSRITEIFWCLAMGLLHSFQAQAQEAEPPGDEDPGFFLWTDTSISLLPYGRGFEVDPDEQSTITLEHAHESRIGDLFMFIDATDYHGQPEGSDSATFYGEIGPRLSFGKLFNREISCTLFERSLFVIEDVLLATQYERGEDPDLSEAALIGIGFDLDIHKAGLLGRLQKFNYVQLNIYGRAELTKGTENGINDAQISMNASYPLDIGGHNFLIDGYFDWVLGLGEEEWSYHLNPQLTMDVGTKWDRPKKFFVGFELDFWWNKYQIPNSSALDTNQQAVSLLFKYHF